jgi:two-component system, response regulator
MDEIRPYYLIADDDPDDQFLIQEIISELPSEDIETRYVNNGLELIHFLTRMNGQMKLPNLIILDLNMPQMDGREALRAIKALPDLSAIPIVVLTTSQVEEDFHFCQSFDVDGYFRKPSSISELRAIIHKLHHAYFV